MCCHIGVGLIRPVGWCVLSYWCGINKASRLVCAGHIGVGLIRPVGWCVLSYWCGINKASRLVCAVILVWD